MQASPLFVALRVSICAMATLREIRRSIGYNLDGIQHGAMVLRSTTEASTDRSVVKDSTLRQQNLDGFWFVSGGSGNLSGVIRRIVESDSESLTLATDLPDLPPSGMEYEVWDQKVQPVGIINHINQAIDEANHRTYVPVMRDDLFLGRYSTSVEIPEDFAYVRDIYYMNPYYGRGIGFGGNVGFGSYGILVDARAPRRRHSSGRFRVGVFRPRHLHDGDPRGGDRLRLPEPRQQLVGYSHIGAVVYGLSADAGLRVTIGGTAFDSETVGRGWHFLSIPITAPSTDEIEEINIRALGSSPVLLYFVALTQEDAIRWNKARFNVPVGHDRAYLGALNADYVRVRINGGKLVSRLDADDDDLPINPAFVVKKATALSLIAFGREDPDSTLFRDWVRQAQLDYLALPTSGNRVRVRR